MKKLQVFISYRRDGGEFLAGRISDKLTDRGYSVFYDIESMHSGPFNSQIYSAINECEDVLLVLPPAALDRCVDEDDWVRKEIEYSLKTNKNIIPILMRDFVFPQNLPESIKDIALREGVPVDSHYFDAMLEKVCSLMKSAPQRSSENENENIKNGVRFLSMKMFSQAMNCFENEICSNVSNPDSYFYGAIAKLEGKRPFLLSRPVIIDVEKYIESAIAYGERALYYYLLAYVKYDYYEKKLLKTALSSTQLLSMAKSLGLTENEKTNLFELIGVTRPEGF